MSITIKENEILSSHTVYRIGGPAKFYVDVTNFQELASALQFAANKKLPFFILGAGSNLLVADNGFNGVVIHMHKGAVIVEGERIIASPATMMAMVSAKAASEGLSGIEWGIGIPGTIGGSVRGNAGCFGGEMKDVVESVRFVDATDISLHEFLNKQCEFGYRDSIFKKHPEWIVASVTLVLSKGNKEDIQNRVREITKKRIEKQDIGSQCCGCIFKNVSWRSVDRVQLLATFLELAQFENQENIPAAFLIENAGLKGAREGNVVISSKHANFFINEGGARASDVLSLIQKTKNAVMQKYGVILQEEIYLLGF